MFWEFHPSTNSSILRAQLPGFHAQSPPAPARARAPKSSPGAALRVGAARHSHIAYTFLLTFQLAHPAQRRLELRQMGQVALTLLRPPFVTRLILCTHQAVGTATTIGHQVQVAAAPPNRLLHVTAPGFGRFEGPCLAVGIREEAAEFTALRTRARDSARTGPIAWRLQRFGDPCA